MPNSQRLASGLNLDVAQRVLQLLVLDLAQAQHLPVLHLCALLPLDTQALAHNSVLLRDVNRLG